MSGISVVGEGPVHLGFFTLGDVTVLTGPNDSGKTRVLQLIEAALNRPTDETGQLIDLFGVASPAEVAALVDRSQGDTEEILSEVEPFSSLRTAVELPEIDETYPLGVRAPIRVELLPVWRYGRAPAQLSENVRRKVKEAGGGHLLGQPDEPLKTEFLGGVDPIVLPEAIAVPSAAALVEAESSAAVIGLCRALRSVAFVWPQVEAEAGPLAGGPDPDEDLPQPTEDDPTGAPSSRWLLREQPDALSLHPAGQRACEAITAIAAQLLPDFISRDYKLEIALRPLISIGTGPAVAVALSRTDPGSGEEDPQTLRFGLDNAASGFRVWLQLAIREASARAAILARILLDGAIYAEQVAWHGSFEVPEPSAIQRDRLEEVKGTLEQALASLADPQALPPEAVIEGF